MIFCVPFVLYFFSLLGYSSTQFMIEPTKCDIMEVGRTLHIKDNSIRLESVNPGETKYQHLFRAVLENDQKALTTPADASEIFSLLGFMSRPKLP